MLRHLLSGAFDNDGVILSTKAMVILGVLSVVLSLLLLRWYRIEQYVTLPRAPPCLVMGHLRLFVKTMLTRPKDAHLDETWFAIKRIHAPSAKYLTFDMRPAVFPPITVVYSHSIAEQCSKRSKDYRYGMPKEYTHHMLKPIIGAKSMTISEGEKWKSSRDRHSPVFACSNIMAFLPEIVAYTQRFLAELSKHAHDRKPFAMEKLCTNLTFDISGLVVLGIQLNAQSERYAQHPIVRHFNDLLPLFAGPLLGNTLSPWKAYRQRKLGELLDASIKEVIQEQFQRLRSQPDNTNLVGADRRCVLDLALEDVEWLSPEVLQEIADHIRGFLWAGHDTTTTLLQWIFYELSIHPQALHRLRSELDDVLADSTSLEAIMDRQQQSHGGLLNLKYLNAVMKETLRLRSPAGSARMLPGSKTFMASDPDTRQQVPLPGIIYLCHYAIHRDPSVFGSTAEKWIPERWLRDEDAALEEKSKTKHGKGQRPIPVSAWRPFERGPRACIGQELARLEARVIVASVVRQFDFEKVGIGSICRDEAGRPEVGHDGEYKLHGEMYSRMQITSKPVDGMLMRVKFREGRSTGTDDT